MTDTKMTGDFSAKPKTAAFARQIVRQIDGVSKVSWADQAERSRGMPLLAETLLSLLIPYLLGLGLAWLVFGRTKKEGYL